MITGTFFYLLNLCLIGRPDDDCTPLHVAALFGHADVVRSLLSAGADLTLAPSKGEYLNKRPYEIAQDSCKQTFHIYLFEQIAMGNTEIVRKLLYGGIPVDVQDGFQLNESTLHWGCSFNHIEVVKLLLSHGCDVNIKNVNGESCLHLACKHKNYELVSLLVREGVNIDAADNSGKSAIDYLLSADKHESVELIIKLLKNPPGPTRECHTLFLSTNKDLLLQAPKFVSNANNSSNPISDGGIDDATSGEDGDYLYDADVHTNGNDLESVTSDDEDVDETDNSQPLLVFWPPTQYQKRRKLLPLVLSSANPVLICVASTDIDIYPLLTWSGLMDTLDRFGLNTQVKRSSTGSKIRLCVDNRIYPGRHRFEIQVNPEQISIIASDSAGLLYAVYTLVQLLQLHSDVSISDGMTRLYIPSIILRDWPDIESRGVIWSYRNQIRTNTNNMKNVIELLSKVRINLLFLVVDPVTNEVTNSIEEVVTDNQNSVDNSTTRVYALDEVCKRYCVELVPTLVLNSIDETLPIDVLKNFSNKMIFITLNYDKVGIDLMLQQRSANSSVTSITAEQACRHACERILSAVQVAGFTAITLSTNKWTKKIGNPVSLAMKLGLSTIEKPLREMFPSTLFIKPIIHIPEIIASLSKHSLKVTDTGSSMSVLPAFLDNEYMYPVILTKYYCFLHAAFAWNRSSTLDMLSSNLDEVGAGDAPNYSIIKEVTNLLLLSNHHQADRRSMECREILSVFSAEVFTASNVSHNEELNADSINLVEKILWTLLTSKDNAATFNCTVPSKVETSQCLRYYKRLLHAADWRVGVLPKEVVDATNNTSSTSKNESRFDAETDEYYAVVHLLSVVCRAIILAYTALEKPKKNAIVIPMATENGVTFGGLLHSLPPGSISDVANSMLESLEHCIRLWRRRFDKSWGYKSHCKVALMKSTGGAASGQIKRSNSNNSTASNNKAELGHNEVAKGVFLSQQKPSVPSESLFKLVSTHLPVSSLEDNIMKLFVN